MAEPEDPVKIAFERFVDSSLPPDEHRRFLELAQANSSIQAELQKQRLVDESLKRLFAAPRGLIGPLEVRTRSATGFKRNWARTFAVAALLGLTVIGAWRTYRFVVPAPIRHPYAPQPWRSMPDVYRAAVNENFRPDWVCKDDTEFAAAVRRRIGTPLVLAKSTGVAALGWRYANTLGPATMCLLTTVESDSSGPPARVMVFMDRLAHDRPVTVAPETGLSSFRRELGSVVLYEITPLHEARVLNLLGVPGTG